MFYLSSLFYFPYFLVNIIRKYRLTNVMTFIIKFIIYVMTLMTLSETLQLSVSVYFPPFHPTYTVSRRILHKHSQKIISWLVITCKACWTPPEFW